MHGSVPLYGSEFVREKLGPRDYSDSYSYLASSGIFDLAIHDRISMLSRDRNQPSILIWSWGMRRAMPRRLKRRL